MRADMPAKSGARGECWESVKRLSQMQTSGEWVSCTVYKLVGFYSGGSGGTKGALTRVTAQPVVEHKARGVCPIAAGI
jgi:hypothetical protein